MCGLVERLERIAERSQDKDATAIREAIGEIMQLRTDVETSRYAFRELKGEWLVFMATLRGMEKERGGS